MLLFLTIHFFHCSDEILRFFEADEAKAFRFACSFVTNDFGSHKRWIFVECTRKKFIVYIVAQISAKYAKIVSIPKRMRMVSQLLFNDCWIKHIWIDKITNRLKKDLPKLDHQPHEPSAHEKILYKIKIISYHIWKAITFLSFFRFSLIWKFCKADDAFAAWMAASAIGFGPFGFSVFNFFNFCVTSNWMFDISIWNFEIKLIFSLYFRIKTKISYSLVVRLEPLMDWSIVDLYIILVHCWE